MNWWKVNLHNNTILHNLRYSVQWCRYIVYLWLSRILVYSQIFITYTNYRYQIYKDFAWIIYQVPFPIYICVHGLHFLPNSFDTQNILHTTQCWLQMGFEQWKHAFLVFLLMFFFFSYSWIGSTTWPQIFYRKNLFAAWTVDLGVSIVFPKTVLIAYFMSVSPITWYSYFFSWW